MEDETNRTRTGHAWFTVQTLAVIRLAIIKQYITKRTNEDEDGQTSV